MNEDENDVEIEVRSEERELEKLGDLLYIFHTSISLRNTWRGFGRSFVCSIPRA
jgi:hypothetical protein